MMEFKGGIIKVKKEKYPRSWTVVIIYALVILPLSYLGRYYQIDEPYRTLSFIIGIFIAELLYHAYRKWKFR